MRARLRSLLIAACVLACAASQAGEQSVRLANLDVAVWQNADAETPQPVILFSHGFHGCATQARFLMEALAGAGYIVFGPNHGDAACDAGAGPWSEQAARRFRTPRTWSSATWRDRAEDIRRLYAAILEDERFRGRVDGERLGLVGHSLGGYTVLGLAGAWSKWTMPGIDAVLALSPYAQPFSAHRTLRRISVPVMYQGGTRDFGITPALARADGVYEQTGEPKFFVEFDDAGHFAWTDFVASAHEPIITYSIAFLDRYVKGTAAAPLLTQTGPGVATLRHAGAEAEALPP